MLYKLLRLAVYPSLPRCGVGSRHFVFSLSSATSHITTASLPSKVWANKETKVTDGVPHNNIRCSSYHDLRHRHFSRRQHRRVSPVDSTVPALPCRLTRAAVLTAAEQGAGQSGSFRTKVVMAELRLFEMHVVHPCYEVWLSNPLDLAAPTDS